MRLVLRALLCGVLMSGARAPANPVESPASSNPNAAHKATAVLTLYECRLEHPLRLSSVEARCGLLPVPENPASPEGAKIDLNIAVVPALNRRATAPPLFLLAGGPGQAATDLYMSYIGAFARINRNHDIVLIDQRGTGRSSPLSCHYTDDWSTTDALPQLRNATRACLAKFGERVRYYTTSLAVGDLNQVRQALGFSTIDLYGSSYGTRVAELFMRRFPQAVGAVILDGVTYPEQIIGPDTPSDAERALNLIVTRCEQAPECAAAYPRLRPELTALRARFGTHHEALSFADPNSGSPLQIIFNRDVLNAALRFLSYAAIEASLLPTLIHEAAEGRLAPLASQTVMFSRQVDAHLASGMQNTVICSEDEPGFATRIDTARMSETYLGGDQLDAVTEVCKIWPRGPVDVDLHAALQSEIPTLLLSGEADPVTPPADAARAARGLTQSRQLVLPGEGHGQLATGCVPWLMAKFLDDPRPRELDATCLRQYRAAPFFVGLSGPAP